MKKTIVAMMIMAMTAASVAGCGSSSNDTAAAENTTDAAADTTATDDTAAAGSMSGAITVLSREDGSGTRGAFIELFGIEQKDADGNKVDNTIDSAEITNSTSVMMTTVAGNKNAIGYVSLGSLDENQVKAVLIDGAQATAENVKDGTYKVSRPFNIATKGEPTGLAKDFIDYILSEEGQAVVEENGYVSEGNTGAFEGTGAEGKITVGGSSSVTPVMEKLIEAYAKVNPEAEIELQTTDSTTGMENAIAGSYDIGMASREVKDEELAEGLEAQVIATDGIAVVVNNANPAEDLTSDQVKAIYTGEALTWDEVTE